MLSITHMATGAIIASKVSNPLLYLPIILVSHFLEDWIPHWDVGTGLIEKRESKAKAILKEIFELGLGMVFLFISFRNPDLTSISFHVWIGAFIALLPDFIEAPKNFLNLNISIFEPINKIHDRFHSMTTDPIVGLSPQLIILWLVYLLG